MYFEIYNLKLDRMINMHSKYVNMHMNDMFYALICINNHVIVSVSCMLSMDMCFRQPHNHASPWGLF